MAIYRPQEPAKDFVKSTRSWLRDPALSSKAKGLLSYIASHSATYELTFEQIVAEMKDDERAIRSGIKELEKSGHLKRWRRRNDDGTLGGYDWQVIDFPDVFAGGDQVAKTQSGSDQGKHGESAGGDHTAKQQPGRDQGEQAVSAGQAHTAKQQGGSEQAERGVSAGGNHTAKRRTKESKELQKEDQRKPSLSPARTPVPGPRDPADDRERDEVTSSSTPQPQDPRQVMVVEAGCPEHLAAIVVDFLEAVHQVKHFGWWKTVHRAGDLPALVAEAVAANTSGATSTGPHCHTCDDTGKTLVRSMYEGDNAKTVDCTNCTNDGRGQCRHHRGLPAHTCGGCRADSNDPRLNRNQQPRSSDPRRDRSHTPYTNHPDADYAAWDGNHHLLDNPQPEASR
jgi:hypothetical protein